MIWSYFCVVAVDLCKLAEARYLTAIIFVVVLLPIASVYE